MTGIERLRELTGTLRENIGDMWLNDSSGPLWLTIINIADQIKRELREERDRWDEELCEAQMDKSRVISVCLEMERHISGVEGAKDSPVARWARELREALGGEKRDPANDVSMSAYDLLPEDEREAVAWVREHGGLERIKQQRRESVPREAYERKRRAWLGHIDECETALGKRRDAIARLADENDALRFERAQMRPRLMPGGMEWLVESWPRFDDDAPLGCGDEVMTSDGAVKVEGLSLTICDTDGGVTSVPFGKRVKRPAPKVLDADGMEIRAGDTVWSTREPKSGTVVYAYPPGDDGQPSVKVGAFWHHASELTHRAPVLAADGRPLREGETVWVTKDSPCDAPLDKGDEVTVRHAYPKFVSVEDRTGESWFVHSDHLTHERHDSWERLEEDARNIRTAMLDSDKLPFEVIDERALDIVRRAMALAERDGASRDGSGGA